MKDKYLFILAFFIVIAFIGIAYADVIITNINTPSGTTSNKSVIIKYNITTDYLNNLTWSWDGSNYSLYDDSLVLFYNFDNRSSLGENDTVVKDLSRYGNNGTVIGGSNITWIPNGKYGGAFNFTNTTGRYINTKSFNFTESGFTISVWAKTNSIIEKEGSDIITQGYNYRLFLDDDGSYRSIVRNSTPADTSFDFGNYSKMDWDNIIYTWDSSNYNFTVYYNGVKVGTSSTKSFLTSDNSILRLGGGGSSGFLFNGSIDDLLIYNRSFSDSEVNQLYKSSLTKHDSQNWTFQTNQSLIGTQIPYQFCLSNLTQQICSTQQSISRISIISSNYSSKIGNINNYFYGANVHNSWLMYERYVDGDEDGSLDELSNLSWHRQTFLNAGLKYAREDMSLSSYYVGSYPLDFESWINISSQSKQNTDGIEFLSGMENQVFNNGLSKIQRTTDSHSGNYAANITALNTTSIIGIDHTAIFMGSRSSYGYYLELGKSYNFSIWAKGNGTVYISLQDRTLYNNYGSSKSITLNSSWQQFSTNITVTYNSSKGYRLVLDNIEGNESVITDDWNLTEEGIDYGTRYWRIGDLTNKTEEYQWARNNGVKILNIISYNVYFLRNLSEESCDLDGTYGTDKCSPLDYDLYAQLVVDYINRSTQDGEYLDVVDYEVWNEPDIGFWESGYPTDHIQKAYNYIKLYNATYTRIKESYPNAVIFGTASAGVYRSNMTNTYLTNLTDTQRNNTFSFHRYTDTPFTTLLSDELIARGNCTLYGANCDRIVWSEWNLVYGGYNETDEEIRNRYSLGYVTILQNYPQDQMITYQWADQYKYNQTTLYPEYPSKWYMVQEPQMGLEYRQQYNITKSFATYCPAGGTVYQSSSDDDTIKTVSCIDNSGKKNIIIINTDTVSKNVSINGLSGLNRLISSDGTQYTITNNTAKIDIMDSYEIMYLQGTSRTAVQDDALNSCNKTIIVFGGYTLLLGLVGLVFFLGIIVSYIFGFIQKTTMQNITIIGGTATIILIGFLIIISIIIINSICILF